MEKMFEIIDKLIVDGEVYIKEYLHNLNEIGEGRFLTDKVEIASYIHEGRQWLLANALARDKECDRIHKEIQSLIVEK